MTDLDRLHSLLHSLKQTTTEAHEIYLRGKQAIRDKNVEVSHFYLDRHTEKMNSVGLIQKEMERLLMVINGGKEI